MKLNDYQIEKLTNELLRLEGLHRMMSVDTSRIKEFEARYGKRVIEITRILRRNRTPLRLVK